MLQTLSKYVIINNINNQQERKNMNTITITEEYAKRYKFPAKAIGTWKIISEKDGEKILHRLKQDGTLGSDRPNNILKVKIVTIEEFFESQNKKDTKQITAKKDGKEVVIAETHKIDNEPKVEKPTEANITMEDENSGKANLSPIEKSNAEKIKSAFQIGTRRSRWIAQLLEVMKSEPFTSQLIEKIGELLLIEKILEDLNSEKKPYSSITSAMKVWNSRIKKGEYATK